MANFNLIANLRANVSNFTRGMAKARSSMDTFKQTTEGMTQRVGQALQGIGAGMTAGVTVPIMAAAAGSVKAFSDMETAMRGVSKTTELTESEFAGMQSEILAMSREMPVAATEIAGVAETAGQLGIEKGNILDFSESMVMLGTSTNMSSQEAATALARLANITGMPQSEFDRLGSVVVSLGKDSCPTATKLAA